MLIEEKRPKVYIPYSTFEKLLEVVSVLGVLINLIMLIKYYSVLPHTIPIHFGPSGKPDDFGGKGTLFILPIAAFVLYSLLTVLSKFPHVYNYLTPITEENAKAQYHNGRKLIIYLKTEIICIFSYIQWGTINVALGKLQGLGLTFLIVFLSLVFGTVGYFIYCSIKLNNDK